MLFSLKRPFLTSVYVIGHRLLTITTYNISHGLHAQFPYVHIFPTGNYYQEGYMCRYYHQEGCRYSHSQPNPGYSNNSIKSRDGSSGKEPRVNFFLSNTYQLMIADFSAQNYMPLSYVLQPVSYQ